PPQPEPKPVEPPKSEKCVPLKKTFFSEPLLEVEVLESEPVQDQPEDWTSEVSELENYFVGVKLPTQPVKLNQCSTITNTALFIESHLATVKANNGKRTFLPYLNRLQELKHI